MLLEALCALLAEDPADELPDPELAEAGAEDGPEEALVDEESPELDPLLEPLFEPLLAPESEPPLLPLDDSEDPEPLPAPASAAVLPTAASLVLLVPPALLRKSVTYQPEPLSWKPAAVTCFS